MTVALVIVSALAAIILPGIYLGITVAIAYTVFKALTKKR